MMKIQQFYQFFLAIVAIGLVSGCDRSMATPFANSNDRATTEMAAKLDRQFEIRYDQVVRIPAEDLDLKFTDVVGDSRCPSDTQCVFQGRVEIVLQVVRGDRDLGNVNLVRQAGLENEAMATIDGYSIQLIDVKPYPQTSQPIELSNYRAIVEVSR
ncbi:MAG TPA: hypothetical protein IGS17_07590 [Oscillatoriales cyanobacterium M59_W2019_021]|nr:hypothetical protein [Oscillatoriales cyanobacterium M4454_W2019_049]HIK50773.1 hypothetical protein [Oscillatoriales cyanobacterium M59_W2019_021]